MLRHSAGKCNRARTVSPVDRFTAFNTEPYVPSPSCFVILYRFMACFQANSKVLPVSKRMLTLVA